MYWHTYSTSPCRPATCRVLSANEWAPSWTVQLQLVSQSPFLRGLFYLLCSLIPVPTPPAPPTPCPLCSGRAPLLAVPQTHHAVPDPHPCDKSGAACAGSHGPAVHISSPLLRRGCHIGVLTHSMVGVFTPLKRQTLQSGLWGELKDHLLNS